MASVLRDPDRLFAPAAVELDRRADGTLRMRSPQPLESHNRCVGEYLEHWATAAPERPFLLERITDGPWVGVSYGEARAQARRIAAFLLQRNLSVERPLAILADNSVEHGLLMLAALHVGVPVMPVSPAYALMSKDFGKLKSIFALTRPGLIFVADHARYAPALAAVSGLHDAPLIVGTRGQVPPDAFPFAALLADSNETAVGLAYAAVGPDTIAKFLFTSGSTDEPKGVINTQRMLCANQQARAQTWPFLRDHPPVMVDWLPWNHTFGGNFNFNLTLRHGGTLYIDGGRPLPALFPRTIGNLREVACTIHANVPRGYDMLVSALRADDTLRRTFFSKLQIIFYAAAALPQNLWDALEELALETVGEKVPMLSAWGLTETAPMATDCHFQAERAGVIGLPVPGCELKLLRNGEKLEVRVRGPNVTPGYWKRPDLTAKSFDAEGFYITGDAVRFVDPDRPELGLFFDGRVAEDFKLSSGTWVNVGQLRIKAVAALAPVAQDIVITGHDRDDVGLLIFPNLAACRTLCPELPVDAPADAVLAHSAVRAHVRDGMSALQRDGSGSSTHATRALLMTEPASIDAGEITDKGYINQRATLTQRRELVELLYRTPCASGVVLLSL